MHSYYFLAINLNYCVFRASVKWTFFIITTPARMNKIPVTNTTPNYSTEYNLKDFTSSESVDCIPSHHKRLYSP